MRHPSLLLITLAISLSSLGSITETSHSLDRSDNAKVTQSTDRVNTDLDTVSDSMEGSGHTSDGTALMLISQVVIPEESDQASNDSPSGPGITLTRSPALFRHHSGDADPKADRANASVTGYVHTREHIISGGAHFGGNLLTAEEEVRKSQSSKVHKDFLNALNSPQHPLQNNMFTSLTKQDFSGPGVSCALGPCVVFTNLNGTNLLWDDMRRTLAFAWELHVFGSASLFILIAGIAVMGTAGACTRPRPFCDALVLANSLLILSGTLRGVLLLLDPYGTRQVLSRATLAALHNVPLQLFLWAQVSLALVTLRGLNLMLFPLKLQHPWVVGVLAVSICTSLFLADLFAPSFSPALPLLLQTLSLCWGLPFCIVILVKSFSHLHPFIRSSVPQWIPSQRIERRAKRVTAVCAILGVFCCSLQMHSLLWLYGLLGNWRRFGWGWWLGQFWARILEVSWGFSLLVLGSWIFWTPSMVQSRGEPGQSRSEIPKMVDKNSLWGRLFARIHKGPLKSTERTWEDLMPSNWAKYNLSRTGFNKNTMCPYYDPPSTITPEYKPDSIYDSQAALLWQKQESERDCILSLIEFDNSPPSPDNLRHIKDNTPHHTQLVDGGLFTASPPSWIEHVGRESPGARDGDGGTPVFSSGPVEYPWTMGPDCKELEQSSSSTRYCNSGLRSQAPAQWEEEETYPQDWSDDDVTDL